MKHSIISTFKEEILLSSQEAVRAAQFLVKQESIQFMSNAASLLSQCFQQGGKLIIAGNGGSLCDAMHFAEELTGQFRKKRAALPAIALSDSGFLTCAANDFGYSQVFARGVEAFGKKGDVLVVLSTSGNSPNILEAVYKAKELEMKTVAFLGKEGGSLKGLTDLEWIVSGFSYSDRVQEAHMAAIHIIIEMIEKELFYVS